MKQLGVLLACCVGGSLLSLLLRGLLPGNVLGLTLLLVLLIFGAIRLHHVESVADFLLQKYNGYKVYWDDGAQIVEPTRLRKEICNICL